MIQVKTEQVKNAVTGTVFVHEFNKTQTIIFRVGFCFLLKA